MRLLSVVPSSLCVLIATGTPNIVCAQPFACLPNHVVGKAVIKRLRQMHPESNIVAVDYDPGASEVNQLNRIKLMISVAKENYKNGVNGEFKLENADDPVTNDATMPYTGRDKFGVPVSMRSHISAVSNQPSPIVLQSERICSAFSASSLMLGYGSKRSDFSSILLIGARRP